MPFGEGLRSLASAEGASADLGLVAFFLFGNNYHEAGNLHSFFSLCVSPLASGREIFNTKQLTLTLCFCVFVVFRRPSRCFGFEREVLS